MHRVISFVLTLALCLLLVHPSVAQSSNNSEEPEEPDRTTGASTHESNEKQIEDVVITANRREIKQNQTGTSISVIEQEEIQRRDKRSVHELLRTLPGVRVSQSGGPGKTTSVFLRGANSDHTLVLVDGFRVNSTTTGSFDFSNLTTENIKRIEVLRGPQSSLYGSEAIGGVINIITKKGDRGYSGHVKGEAGSHDSRFGEIHAQGGTELYDFSVSLSNRRTDGISALDPATGDGDDDGYRNTTVSGRFGYSVLEDGRVELTVRGITDHNELDGITDDPNAEQERNALFTGLKLSKPVTNWWNQKIQFGVNEDNLDGDDPDTASNRFNIDKRVSQFLWQSEFTPVKWNTITAGHEIEKRVGKNKGTFDRDLYIRSFFLQDRVTLEDRLTVTAAVRNDDHDTFGSETTYRVSSSLRFPVTNTRFHGHYGTGFRAPDLNELFFTGPFGSGNPNLEPEESEGFDVGVEQSFLDQTLTFDVTYFENDFENLIEFAAPNFIAQNVREAESDGYEVTGDARLSERWSFSSTYTFTDTRNFSTDQPLDRRPEDKFTISTSLDVNQTFSGSLSWIMVRERHDNGGVRLDDYNRLDLSARYKTPYSLDVTLRINNLLDQEYNEVQGFNAPGFNGYLGLVYHW